MKRGLTVAAAAVSLVAPQALSQDVGSKLLECRLPFREAIAGIIKRPILKREKDDAEGGMARTIVLSPAGMTVFGQPVQAFNVKKIVTGLGESDSFISKVALDFPAMSALVPKAFAKTKCDATGTSLTYCSMYLPKDSAANRAVSLSIEPAEGSGTMIICTYQKIEG